MASALTTNDYETELCELAASLVGRPYEFVMTAWPWGKPGTWLEHEVGPDEWQRNFLLDLGEEIRERNFNGQDPVDPILMAAGSGHGVGKSTKAAWLIHFIAVTRPFSRGVVTASTGPQLESKTIPELAKWQDLCIFGHWFELRASIPGRFSHKDYPETWRVDFQTSKKENSDAFQGLHAATSTPYFIFDESSGIPDKIWEVAEGGLTDGEPMWFAFGNRTRNIGRFNDCFGKLSHRWLSYVVDSRKAKKTNKQLIARWITDWGIDSDFVRVRVLGLAPKEASEQLISRADIEEAQGRPALAQIHEPLVMGIDVARFGEDRSVFAFRKGRDARSHKLQIFHGVDLMTLAEKAAEAMRELRPDVVNIDGGGVGGGVVDRLRQLGFEVNEVNFGGRSPDREYHDMRSCMWGRLAKWLKESGAIEQDEELTQDLVAQQYLINRRTRATQLISKEDLHRLGERSSDLGDALALTHAFTIADMVQGGGGGASGGYTGAQGRRGYHPTDRLDS